MDRYKLKFTTLQYEILRFLCVHSGEKVSQRAISLHLGVSPTAIANSMPALEKEGMIKREIQKPMNLALISLNRDNPQAIQFKRAENLRLIYESGLIEFLEEELPGGTIILFGSYSRGDDTNTSDIDLAVIGRKEKSFELEKFEKVLERKIMINFYDSMAQIHKHLRENICNGIVLSGGVEL